MVKGYRKTGAHASIDGAGVPIREYLAHMALSS
jgi:hypothetical protein